MEKTTPKAFDFFKSDKKIVREQLKCYHFFNMLPLYDESAPSLKPPYVTLALILLNVLIFALVFFSENFEEIILKYGTTPSQILEGRALFTLFTSIFLHAGILHLVGNMWFLWLFGDNIEHNLGKIRFLIFYLAVGIFASLFHVFGVPLEQANIPAVGASGAISGLLGGYLILFPKNRIRAFLMIFFYPIFFWVPAYFYIGLWFFYQIFYIGAPPLLLIWLILVVLLPAFFSFCF